MADSIRVSMTPATVQFVPGGDPAEAVITVQNAGTTVDQYAVELDGLPTTWYTLSNTSVALFPQDKEEARLTIRPPTGGVKAGLYPFTITVLSRADTTQTSRIEGTMQIGALAAFEIDIAPRKVVGRKGRYTLTMRNGGNCDLDAEMDAFDAEGECAFTFTPARPRVAAGQRATAQLAVTVRRSGWVGPKKQYDFQVKARPSQGEQKTLQGQLIHTPHFGSWRPIRRTGLVAVLAAFIVAAFTYPPVQGPAGQMVTVVRQQVCSRLGVSYICSALPM